MESQGETIPPGFSFAATAAWFLAGGVVTALFSGSLAVLAKHAGLEEVLLVGMIGIGSTAGRFFLGSMAERTVREAPCPVLVLREGAAPFDAWAAGQRPLRITIAVDFSEASDAAWEWVKTMRRIAPCDVTLVHRYLEAT